MRTLNIDIETYSSADLKTCGMYKYAEAKDFDILMIAFSIDEGRVQVFDLASPETDEMEYSFTNTDITFTELVIMLCSPDVKKIAYNAQFERVCLAKYLEEPMPPEQWECTMIKGAMLGLPMGLASIGASLKLTQQKDFSGSALIRYFCLPCKGSKVNGGRDRNLPEHAPDKWKAFIDYCKADVRAEMAIGKKLSFFNIPDREKKLWCLDQRINERGVLVDKKLVRQAVSMDATVKEELTKEAIELTGLDNPNSVQQLMRWLTQETGDEILNLRKADVPILLKKYEDATVSRVLHIRKEMAKTSVKKYLSMANTVCEDGYIRGLFQFAGARTMRWSGRLVQMQNLPKNYLVDLSLARELVRDGDKELLEMAFGNVPDTLSQLIRTAFVAPKGQTLAVLDFSAIEARVLAWVAEETWRLEVFATHGKIYEASASKMFKVPMESVAKGSELRQKGKVSELALGYQGGTGALLKMGALEMGLLEEDLQGLIDAWRQANPNIVKFWKLCNDAAISAVQGCAVDLPKIGLRFYCEKGYLFIKLPSGRSIAYYNAVLKPGKFGGNSVSYMGVDSTTKKWKEIDSYGGKWVENCLSADTKVVTLRGAIDIVDVNKEDYLWDGRSWVRHSGIILKGTQTTLSINGVRMTADHKILTNEGWAEASSIKGFSWYDVPQPYRFRIPRLKREKVALESKMRVRESGGYGSFGVYENEAEILRVYEREASSIQQSNSWNVKPQSLLGLEVNERQMQTTDTSSVAQLRRSGHSCLRKMAKKFYDFLGGYGIFIQRRIEHREKRREWELQQRELHLGNFENSSAQQKRKHKNKYTLGVSYGSRSGGKKRDWSNNLTLSAKSGGYKPAFICETGFYEPVYDIVNAGPLRRFAVVSDNGLMIVHNCVQAIARDCLAEALLGVEELGYHTVAHVHDEIIVPLNKETAAVDFEILKKLMSTEMPWAKGLPLEADGYLTDFYKKD